MNLQELIHTMNALSAITLLLLGCYYLKRYLKSLL